MIETKLADGVLTLCIARPEKKNALTSDMYAALADGLLQANQDDSVGSVLICGEGAVFCAGNDIADFAAFALNAAPDDLANSPVARFIAALVENQKPLVAVVQGRAIGIGFTLLLHCDLVVAQVGTEFSTPFVDLGLVPEAGSSHLLPLLVGQQRAARMLLVGETVTAEELSQWGIVSHLVADDLIGIAAKLAYALAIKPRQALLQSRRLLRPDSARLRAVISEEMTCFAQRLTSPEAQQAFQSFLSR